MTIDKTQDDVEALKTRIQELETELQQRKLDDRDTIIASLVHEVERLKSSPPSVRFLSDRTLEVRVPISSGSGDFSAMTHKAGQPARLTPVDRQFSARRVGDELVVNFGHIVMCTDLVTTDPKKVYSAWCFLPNPDFTTAPATANVTPINKKRRKKRA